MFLLTYERNGKDPIDVFNDFSALTFTKIPPSIVPELLEMIRRTEDLGIDQLVLIAEKDKLIPEFIYQLKNYKTRPEM